MDPDLYRRRGTGLSLEELLQELEKEDDEQQIDIYAIPPIDGNDTDMDEDLSDDEHLGDLNCLGPKLLKTTCEFEIRHESEVQELVPIQEDVVGDWDSSDDEPLMKYVNTNKKPKKSKIQMKWKKFQPDFDMVTDCQGKPASEAANQCNSPLEFFKLFFTDDYFNEILIQTNLYSAQNNNQLNMTLDEMYVFIGGLLLSGYARYPNKRMFWSSSPDVPEILQNSMRLNRFEQILRNFHLNDNTNLNTEDRLFKVRPTITHLNEVFRAHGGLDENLSIDESMIPYYGKHYAKQYIKGKPIRFGFKNWALCTSFGYLLAFEIYCGKGKPSDEKIYGLGGDMVLSLIYQANIPSNRGYKFYFDNYFSSTRLMCHLSDLGYCATGTIQASRTGNCPLLDVKSIDKKPRGFYDYQSDVGQKVSLVRWKDNKSVTCITNYDSVTEESTCTRYSREKKAKIAVTQPKPIANYNKGMGGVDKMDQAVAAYRTRMRQKKWWWPIFVYLLDVSVSNAWLLMRRVLPKDKMAMAGLLNFRRSIAVDLLTTYGTASSRGKITKVISDNIRYDGNNHLIEYNATERRCGFCGKKSHFICGKCNTGLHPKICFKNYHSK